MKAWKCRVELGNGGCLSLDVCAASHRQAVRKIEVEAARPVAGGESFVLYHLRAHGLRRVLSVKGRELPEWCGADIG